MVGGTKFGKGNPGLAEFSVLIVKMTWCSGGRRLLNKIRMKTSRAYTNANETR